MLDSYGLIYAKDLQKTVVTKKNISFRSLL